MVGALKESGWVGASNKNIVKNLSEERKDGTFYFGSIQYWLVKNNNEDYHNNFNQTTFLQYFKKRVLPFLRNPLWSYWTTPNIISFLAKILCTKGFVRESYADMATTSIRNRKNCSRKRATIFTPYHPELSPVELAWGE